MKHFLLSSAIVLAGSFGAQAQINGYNVGQTVSDFTVTDTHGNQHNLYTYTAQGKWVVLDFFFDTCGPCQATAPTFNELHEKYGCNEGDLVCISVNNGTDNDAEVLAFEMTYGGSFSHAPAISTDGGAGAVAQDFAPGAFPTYCLIGADNTLKNADIWPLSNGVGTFESAFSAEGFSPTAMACAVGIEETPQFSDVKLYPNPTNAQTTLEFEMESGKDVKVSVYSLVGTLVLEDQIYGQTGNNVHVLNTDGLSNGQYLIKCTVENEIVSSQKLNVLR